MYELESELEWEHPFYVNANAFSLLFKIISLWMIF